jgi:hypothetical protein
MNASGFHEIDIDAQQIVKVGEQSAKIEQPPALIQVYKEVDVTIWTVLARGHRAEYANIATAVQLCPTQNFGLLFPTQCVQR